MRARMRTYSTMVAPRSVLTSKRALSQVLTTKEIHLKLTPCGQVDVPPSASGWGAEQRMTSAGFGENRPRAPFVDRLGPERPVSAGFGGLAQANDPDAHRGEHGLGPVPGLELLVDRRQVVLHGLAADEQVGWRPRWWSSRRRSAGGPPPPGASAATGAGRCRPRARPGSSAASSVERATSPPAAWVTVATTSCIETSLVRKPGGAGVHGVARAAPRRRAS